MSLRTKINGFTAWVNLRLTPYNQLLNNVLMDLLTGTHMKYLLESFTGSHLKGLENLDGLTDQQKQTRIDWVVEELKKKHVIAEDVFVDTRLFAMRSADHVFNLLWRLISHDIWFVWERAEFLQVDDPDILTQVHFTWTPEPPPKKKKSKNKQKKSLLSGFGASITTEEKPEKPDDTPRGTQICWNFGTSEKTPVNPLLVKSSPTEQLQQSNTLASSASKIVEENIDIEEVDGINDCNSLAESFDESEDRKEINESSGISRATGLAVIYEHDNECNDDAESDVLGKNTDKDINADDIDNGTDDYLDQADYNGKPMVSIYMMPLKDADDSDEDITTFSGRFSPWLLEEEELDSYQEDTTNDLQLGSLDNTSLQTPENGSEIINESRTEGLMLSLENKTGHDTISENKEDTCTEIETENTKEFLNENRLENKFNRLSVDESHKLNEKNSPSPKGRFINNHAEKSKSSRVTKAKSQRKGKKSSSKRKKMDKKVDEGQVKESECKKEIKQVRFEDDEDLSLRTIKSSSESSDEEMNQVENV